MEFAKTLLYIGTNNKENRYKQIDRYKHRDSTSSSNLEDVCFKLITKG